jgi:hypothetical protein
VEGDESARFSSANLPTLGAAGPPGQPEIERVRDVLLVAGDPAAEHDDVDSDALILLPRPNRETYELIEKGSVELGGGVRIEKLEQDEGELVMNACSARGHYFAPVRQFGQMYSFVVDVELGEVEDRRWTWNTAGVLSDAVEMSRLILDNDYSYEYAARIFTHVDGQQHVMPAHVDRGAAYRLRRTSRIWLTDGEAAELRRLLEHYWARRDELPDRVLHAKWLAEYVVFTRWLDVIGPLLVVAFEALVGTSKQLVTRQFTERVPALTEDVGVPLSQTHCENVYDARSRFVHGNRISLWKRPQGKGESWEGPTDDEQEAAVRRIELTRDALRAVLRRCIEDAEFCATFVDAQAIRERWPIEV